MPGHAVSASQAYFEDANGADTEVSASSNAQHDGDTFSPPLVGNDVSGCSEAIDDRISAVAARAAGYNGEKPQDGNNDNIPRDRALVIVSSSSDIAAAGQSSRRNGSRPFVLAGVLTLLGLGAAGFSYNSIAGQKENLATQAQLASVPAALPETNRIEPPSSASETNTGSLAAAAPLPQPAPAPTAQPESISVPALVPEEKTAAVTPEPAPQPSAALPEPAAIRAAAEPAPQPAQEETAPAPGAPQITPNNITAPSPAQAARSVTPSAGPARGQFVFVQRPNVNIRNAPSDRGLIIGIAQIGGRFVVARSDGEWVQVAQGPWRGWINSRFLASRLPRG
jgi:hypothetical protein